MNDFALTTAFDAVRRIAVSGAENPSAVLLICDASLIDRVEADLVIEFRVQTALDPRLLPASQIDPRHAAEVLSSEHRPTIITVKVWPRGLFESLDRHVVLLTNLGPVLILASAKIANRILRSAPNLSSRLADVLRVATDPGEGSSI
jgi:hypothetical protein